MTDTTTTTAPIPPAVTSAVTITEEISSVLLSVIPALTPYGPVIALAFDLAAKVAPPVYAEMKLLIAQIQGGGEPTADQIAALQKLTAGLSAPEDYFATPTPPLPTAPDASGAAVVPGKTWVKVSGRWLLQ